jgi:sugar fermentation stimulation protein A
VQFPPLIPGRLLRRYKRFLADVELAGGEVVTAAVANPGGMQGLAEPGMEVQLAAFPPSAKRKLNYSWVLVRAGRNLVCVDTSVANRVVEELLYSQAVPQLAGYRELVREMPLGEGSRIDFFLRAHEDNMLGCCWVEVKSVTLAQGRTALFPDAVTSRGRRHLQELARRVGAGERAVQLYFVPRGDIDRVRPAEQIDPAYAAALRDAAAAGVELLAIQAAVTKRGIEFNRQVPVEL